MKFQLSYFKSWKMMLWKCCTQYASKFGKLSSDHRTGKGQFSFQSQRNAMQKNAQTTTNLHSSHMMVKYCWKFTKPSYSNTWTMNFQMFQLVLEKADEPGIKLPTSSGSSKKQESARKTSTYALLTKPKPLTVWITQRRQRHPTPVLLPGKSHGQRSLVGCSPWVTKSRRWLHFHFSLSCIGEGNGNPIQCSCLENPRDGGAWWAAVYGVTQSQIWLKRLSSVDHNKLWEIL